MAFNPAIAGIGVVGASAVVGGGLSIGGALNEGPIEDVSSVGKRPELKIEGKEPQNGYVLVDDGEYDKNKTEYENKYGKKFEMSFIGVDNRIVDTGKTNNHGGTGSYKHSYRQDATEGFASTIITGGKELKAACKEAYKGTLDENTKLITFEEKSTKYKEEEVGEFCSGIHRKPTAISDNETYAQNTIGANNRSKLISTKDSNNDSLGDTRTFYFLRNNQKAPSQDNEKFFKKLHDEQRPKFVSGGYDNLAVKKGCEKAYSLQADTTSTSADKPTEAEVIKYCSIEDKYQARA